MRASAAEGVRHTPGRFVPGEPDFQGLIASVHEHGVRLHADADREQLRGYAFHAALWASLLIVVAALGLLALFEADWFTGAFVIGGGAWAGVAVWRWAWQREARACEGRVVLIDRRRGCVVSIDPGREEAEVSLAYGYTYCPEGPVDRLESELVMACGDQQVRLGVWKDRHRELWLAIKGYGLKGDLPLSAADVRQMQVDAPGLIGRLRDALSPSGYRRAWVERPVSMAWRHLLWPVFVLFTVFRACSLVLSLRVNPVSTLPAEAWRRLGPVRHIDLATAPVPAWPEVGRAISKGMLYVVGVAPAIGAALVHTSFFLGEFQLRGQEWVLLQSFTSGLTVWHGFAAYGAWGAVCVLLFRMAAWKRRDLLGSAVPWIWLAATLLFPFAVWGTTSMLDTLNMVADEGPPLAQFRGRVSGVNHWKVEGKAARYTSDRHRTSLTISPMLGVSDMRPISTSVQGHRNVRIGAEMCAEVYPGYFGRPWLSRLRDCSEPLDSR